MSIPLLFACLWVFAATATAFLPMRLQFAPGLTLLIAAPILLIWIGIAHGVWVTLIGALAVLSMFRRPLMYFARRLMTNEPVT